VPVTKTKDDFFLRGPLDLMEVYVCGVVVLEGQVDAS